MRNILRSEPPNVSAEGCSLLWIIFIISPDVAEVPVPPCLERSRTLRPGPATTGDSWWGRPALRPSAWSGRSRPTPALRRIARCRCSTARPFWPRTASPRAGSTWRQPRSPWWDSQSELSWRRHPRPVGVWWQDTDIRPSGTSWGTPGSRWGLTWWSC